MLRPFVPSADADRPGFRPASPGPAGDDRDQRDDAGAETRRQAPLRGRGAPPFLVIETPGLVAALAVCARAAVPVPVPFEALSASLVARLAPRAVAFALIAESHDAVQVLDRLAAIGFCGRIIAFAPPLPNRAMIQAELRAHAEDAWSEASETGRPARIRLIELPRLPSGV